MLLQVSSDLHTEFHSKVTLSHFINPSADYLLLAGDVGLIGHPSYRSILEQCNAAFKKTILIKGNHECYGESFEGAKIKIRELIVGLDNIVYLDNEAYRFEDDQITVLGTTLWSHVMPNEKIRVLGGINDYRQIERNSPDPTKLNTTINIEHSNQEHAVAVHWLNNELDRVKKEHPEDKVIIMSHHLPSYAMVPEKYRTCGYNSAFATDLEHMFQHPIVLWVCGHSHGHRIENINGIPCVLNPGGYPSEVTRSNHSFVIRV